MKPVVLGPPKYIGNFIIRVNGTVRLKFGAERYVSYNVYANTEYEAADLVLNHIDEGSCTVDWVEGSPRTKKRLIPSDQHAKMVGAPQLPGMEGL